MRQNLLLFLLFNSILVFSQTSTPKLPQIVPPSADASALGRYGLYPTDLSQGLVNINIPLYTISEGNLQVPIGLSYHASGIRVNDIPSWVGLGWSLNAGGVLTRTVMGKPDELSGGFLYKTFMTKEQLDNASPQDFDSYVTGMEGGSGTDTESDLYSFNVNGLSGSFVYNSNHELVQMPVSNCKIVANDPGSKYTITGEDGTMYTLDVDETTYSLSNTFKVNTSFYLSKIISANRADTIYFDYLNDSYTYSDWYVTPYVVDYNPYTNYHPGRIVGDSPSFIYTENSKYLSRIRYKGGYIDFVVAGDRADRRKYRLVQVKIFTNDGSLIRLIDFNHDYFVSDSPHSPTYGSNFNSNIAYRLKLTGVVVKDQNETGVQPYSFSYYSSANLPPYKGAIDSRNPQPNLYNGQDYFGYYNGVTTNDNLRSVNPSSMPSAYIANRSVNPYYTQAAILTQIKFPTGGKTKFLYESNTTASQSVGLLGGLRITSMETYTKESDVYPAEKKVYSYLSGGDRPWMENNYLKTVYSQVNADYYPPNDEDPYPGELNKSTVATQYISSPLFPMTYGATNGIFYRSVAETSVSQDNSTVGQILSEFEYEQDPLYATTVNIMNQVPPRYVLVGGSDSYYPINLSWARGPLKRQTFFKTSLSGSLTEVRKLEYVYTKFKEQTSFIGNNVFANYIYSGSYSIHPVPKQQYQYFDIKYTTGVKKLTQSIETTDGVIRTTNYYYDNPLHMYLTRTEQINSEGQLEKDEKKYPQDKGSIRGLNSEAAVALDEMINRNMVNTVIESKKSQGATVMSTERCDYKIVTIGDRNIVVPATYSTSTLSNNLEPRKNYSNYDYWCNILQSSIPGGAPEAYKWGYSNQYLIAKVSNAKSSFVVGNGSGQMNFGSTSYPINGSVTFTQTISGPMSFNLYPTSWGNTGTANYSYTLSGPQYRYGTMCFSTEGGCSISYPSSVNLGNMPAGQYTLTVNKNTNTISNVTFAYNYSIANVNSEFYCESFEENTQSGVQTGLAHTGRKYSTNASVSWAAPSGRSYLISYWYLSGGVWQYSGAQSYNGSNFSMLSASGYDDIRIYPTDALMTTYTYDPLVGLTSSTDARNQTTYYEYDSFQRLKAIKDSNGNILKSYDYHYKPQN